MKTREELASEYGLKFFKKSFKRIEVDDISIGEFYKDGFDDGFARAVEMAAMLVERSEGMAVQELSHCVRALSEIVKQSP